MPAAAVAMKRYDAGMQLPGTIDAPISPFAELDVADLLAHRAAEHPERDLLIWAPADGPEQRWTYARFLHEVRCLAGGLAARGIGRGDRVLVHLENSPETLLARFACAWLGAVCVATNAMATGPEFSGLADTVGARAAITQPAFAELVAQHASGLEWIAVTRGTDGTSLPEKHGDSFALLFGEPLQRRTPDPSLPALILFTTGTTAGAKAALWTQENLLWAACLGAQQQRFLPNDVVQLYLPLFHVVGFSWAFLPVMWAGATAVLQPRFSASRFWPVALTHRTTMAAHVPFTISALMKTERPANHHFRQWITNQQMPREQDHFGIDRLSSAWGMTEMVSQPLIGNAAKGELMPHTIGRPSLGYEVRIVDEAGRAVERGGSGELLVRGTRGRSIFLEYFGNIDATRSAFDENGFFLTGDRVRLNPDGSITFVDRIKDVIKVGGEGVAAGEIEVVIRHVPGVSDVAVVAGPDAMRGEVPVACVVRALDAALPDDQLRLRIDAECRRALARFKVPQHIIFIQELPRVGFGKISKARLRALAADAVKTAGTS